MLAVLLAADCWAVPCVEGLSGLLRDPTAFTAAAASTFNSPSGGLGLNVTLPVASALEAGVTRDRGATALSGKLQLFGGSDLVPAVALGVQDVYGAIRKRRYFWVASEALPGVNGALHAGLHLSDGFASGPKQYYAGGELGIGDGFRFKAEYDWGITAGSLGLEYLVSPRVVAYDYELDTWGPNKKPSNVIGLSYQDKF